MAKTHRAIQNWDHWLLQSLGCRVLEAEQQFLPHLLTDCYGKHVLLIGVPNQYGLLKFSSIPHQVLLSPTIHKKSSLRYVESDFNELPIASASIDLVVMPHTLELIDNPQHLLSEACRIVKPEGHIIIFGFNPYSLWGLKQKLTRNNTAPWSNNFISAGRIAKWLKLSDFELVKQDTLLFRPPLQNYDIFYSKIKFIEWLGSKLWAPLGGVYMLMAKAKVIPMTPIKLHWKQQLSGIQVTTSGPSIRNWQ